MPQSRRYSARASATSRRYSARASATSRRHSARPARTSRRATLFVLGSVVIAAAVVSAALVVVTARKASSGQGAGAGSATTASSNAPLEVAPLTGLPVSDPSVLDRPAIDMKIDDDYYAQPQSGINQADLVYEEVVEGGIDRWLAVFQSQGADPVGPVRSVRETDADLVAPIGGLFAYSGGIAPFVADVMATGVKDVGASTGDPSAYTRNPDREEPDNLYTSTAELWADDPSDTRPPQPLFDYRALGAPFDAQGAASVGTVTIQMSAETSVAWQWNPSAGAWERSEGDGGTPTPSDDASGKPIAFTNVIVEYVPYHDTGYTDPDGNPVPDAATVGAGEALVFSGGSVARATWSKPTERSATLYRDANGRSIEFAPGNTWVELVPTEQPAPQCAGGSGLASQICLSVVPASGISSTIG